MQNLEITLNRDNSILLVILKEMGIAISFGVVYFTMCVMNPLAGLTGIAGLFSANIRWASLLRAFALVSPSSSIGIGFATIAYTVYSGKIVNPTQLIVNVLVTAIAIGIYFLSRKIGRSKLKDISLLAIFGLLVGIITKLNLVLIAVIMGESTFAILFESVVWLKILLSMVLFMAGYPLLMIVRRVQNEDKYEKGSSSK